MHTNKSFMMFSIKFARTENCERNLILTTNFSEKKKENDKVLSERMNKGEKSLSFLTPPLIIWNCHQRASPYHIFWKIKEWYSMYILVRVCTVRICTWTLNREKIVS